MSFLLRKRDVTEVDRGERERELSALDAVLRHRWQNQSQNCLI
jgi:hypothetical protein